MMMMMDPCHQVGNLCERNGRKEIRPFEEGEGGMGAFVCTSLMKKDFGHQN